MWICHFDTNHLKFSVEYTPSKSRCTSKKLALVGLDVSMSAMFRNFFFNDKYVFLKAKTNHILRLL